MGMGLWELAAGYGDCCQAGSRMTSEVAEVMAVKRWFQSLMV